MRISRSDQLPDWFDLCNYDGIDKFDAEKWWLLISDRKKIYNFLRLALLSDRSITNTQSPIRKLSLDSFQKLVNNPLATSRSSFQASVNRSCFVPSYSFLKTCMYVWEPSEETINKRGFFTPEQITLFIDLSLSDQTILRRVEFLLQELREKADERRSVAKYKLDSARTRIYEINKWAECGLLPYIDLRLWEKITDNYIRWNVISEATFPPGEGSMDQTRQTVDPLAQELLFVGNGMIDLERLIAKS